jgi:hypothetical protein
MGVRALHEDVFREGHDITQIFLTAVLHGRYQQYSQEILPLSKVLQMKTTFRKHLLPSSGETTNLMKTLIKI